MNPLYKYLICSWRPHRFEMQTERVFFTVWGKNGDFEMHDGKSSRVENRPLLPRKCRCGALKHIYTCEYVSDPARCQALKYEGVMCENCKKL